MLFQVSHTFVMWPAKEMNRMKMHYQIHIWLSCIKADLKFSKRETGGERERENCEIDMWKS